jgi:sodium/pantothenate symporter
LKKESDVNKYLTTAIIAETIFFMVVVTGLYARILFPDLKVDGLPVRVDSIIPAYVIKEFPVYVGILVLLGLISAGISTLEGLIQSLSTTITADIIKPLFGKSLFKGEHADKKEIATNKMVIVALAIVSVLIAYDQLINPNLSVAILAQNGVYAYFAAAFIPVFFGSFLKDAPKYAAFSASVVAIIIHFTVYYGNITSYMQGPVKNPAIPATFAIIGSIITGFIVYFATKKKNN